MDSLLIDVVVGLVFVFGTFALLTSTLTEVISRFFGLRGEYLLRGIRTLVDGEGKFELPDLKSVGAFFGRPPRQAATKPPDATITTVMNNPVVKASGNAGTFPASAGNAKLRRRDRRALPSYISSRAFAQAVLDVAVPNATGQTTFDEVEKAIEGMPKGVLKETLTTLVRHADRDTEKLRQAIERWYDDQMDRVSGWYKRHVRWISLGIAAVLAAVLNINAVQIGDALYGDQALRESVVTQSVQTAKCEKKSPSDCLDDVRKELGKSAAAGLPIGWSTVSACAGRTDCSWADRHGFTSPSSGKGPDLMALALFFLGYGLMVLVVLPGARFWFGLLSRFGSLRESGPKPAATTA
jgi:hypothetical protein